MAEQAPGSGQPERYQPGTTDWRSLVVLTPTDVDEAHQQGQALQRALSSYAVDLLGPQVEVDETTGNLHITFNLVDSESQSAVATGIAGVCHGVGVSQIGEPEFVAMQLANELDILFFGDELMGHDSSHVGQPAYDAYLHFSQPQQTS